MDALTQQEERENEEAPAVLREPPRPSPAAIPEGPPDITESPIGPQGEPPGGSARRRRVVIIVAAALLLLLVFLVVRGLHRGTATEQRGEGQFAQGFSGGEEAPIAVSAVRAESGDIAVRIPALGTVTPLATVTVKTQVTGQLQTIAFKEGQ
ncbi:MAG TPA: hypothetical protein VGI35_10425, partial [Steroidobacteraceae bacterium]